MHLVLATVGTRGDVQPYVAVAHALAGMGHRVTVATHEDQRALVEAYGLGFRPVCGNFRELMATPAGTRWLTSGASVGKYLAAFRELYAAVAESWIADLDAALADADAVLVHAFCFAGTVVARRRGLRYVVLSPFTAIPSRELSAGLPRIPLLSPWLCRVALAYVLDKTWSFGDVPFARYLGAHEMMMPKQPLWREQLREEVPHLHLFSEHVVPRPRDWPACAEVTGYCFLDAPSTWQPSQTLARFVAAEPKPVYVGFGSMTGMEPEKLATLTREALRRSQQRAVVGMGWGGIRGFEPSDDMLVVDDVPHDWLFPRVAAVVQHCGAGTTAAALRAGRPTVAVPFFADQTFWGTTLHDLGAAPPPVPKKKLTVERLAAAITRAVSDARYAERAETIGAAIRAENGAALAAERALHHLARS